MISGASRKYLWKQTPSHWLYKTWHCQAPGGQMELGNTTSEKERLLWKGRSTWLHGTLWQTKQHHPTHPGIDVCTSGLAMQRHWALLSTVWKWWDKTRGQTSTSILGEMQSTHGQVPDPTKLPPSRKLNLPTAIIPSQHQEQIFLRAP